ncbi:unnamed protein product, partial [Amoebophrya sp. A25]
PDSSASTTTSRQRLQEPQLLEEGQTTKQKPRKRSMLPDLARRFIRCSSTRAISKK